MPFFAAAFFGFERERSPANHLLSLLQSNLMSGDVPYIRNVPFETRFLFSRHLYLLYTH